MNPKSDSIYLVPYAAFESIRWRFDKTGLIVSQFLGQGLFGLGAVCVLEGTKASRKGADWTGCSKNLLMINNRLLKTKTWLLSGSSRPSAVYKEFCYVFCALSVANVKVFVFFFILKQHYLAVLFQRKKRWKTVLLVKVGACTLDEVGRKL